MTQLAELTVDLALKGWDEIKEKLHGTKGYVEIVERAFDRLRGTGATLTAATVSNFTKLREGLKSIKESFKAAFDMKGWKEAIERFKSDQVYFGTYRALVDRIKPSFEKLTERVKRLSEVSKYGFAVGTASILGFVRAGLQGTAQGELMQYRMQLLSREIAGVFLPTVNNLNEYLGRAVGWFRSLTHEEQESIRKNVELGLKILAVAMVLPKLVTAVQAATSALAAMAAHPVLTGLALVAAGIAAITFQAIRGHEALQKHKSALEALKQGKVTPDVADSNAGIIGAVKRGPKGERTKDEQAQIAHDLRMEALHDLQEEQARNKKREQGFGSAFNKVGSAFGLVPDEHRASKEREHRLQERVELLKQLQAEAEGGKKLDYQKRPSRNEVTLAGGQWQQLGDAWRAGQAAVLAKGGDDPVELAKDQVKLQERIAAATETTAGKKLPTTQ